jgi:hypothetical protein
MSKPKSVTDDLRGQLGALEGRQVELLAERDEVSYTALVDRDPKAVKSLAAINEELSNIAKQSASVGAALKEAAKREAAAEDADRAKRRLADAEKASALLQEIEDDAVHADAALRTHGEKIEAMQTKIAAARRLVGAGPEHMAVIDHLCRATSVSLATVPVLRFRFPMPPGPRPSVTQLAQAWVHQIRTKISAIVETAKAAA